MYARLCSKVELISNITYASYDLVKAKEMRRKFQMAALIYRDLVVRLQTEVYLVPTSNLRSLLLRSA